MEEDEITEAQVAEANTPDTDDDDTGSDDAPPAETQPDVVPPEEGDDDEGSGEPESLAVAEERAKEWDRVSRYLAKNVGDIEGDDAIYKVECPCCRSQGTPGYIDPRIPADSEIIGPVLSWFGMRSDADYAKDNYSRECDECHGLGETLSGSKVQGRDKLVCFRCKGNGWVPVGDERGAGLAGFTNGATSYTTDSETTSAPSYMPDGTEPPEVAALRERGFVVIAPIGSPS